MKIIPKHSLSIFIGPRGPEKIDSVKNRLGLTTLSAGNLLNENYFHLDYDNHIKKDNVFNMMYDIAKTKLILGQQVILDFHYLINTEQRIRLANLGRNLGVPVYYIIDPDENILNDKDNKEVLIFKKQEKNLMKGDGGLAEVIDRKTESYSFILNERQSDITNVVENFDGITVIPDIHGMKQSLLSAIDWSKKRNHHMVMLGDIIDYGPSSLECLDLVYDEAVRGNLTFIPGNHEWKIYRWLHQSRSGKIKVKLSDGNKITTKAIEALSKKDKEKVEMKLEFLMSNSFHIIKAHDIVFTHGAIHPKYWLNENDVSDPEIKKLALFGQTKGLIENKHPNRIYDWCNKVPKDKIVIVGHDILGENHPTIIEKDNCGKVIFLDCGCGKGGKLHTVDFVKDEKGNMHLQLFQRH